MAIKKLFAFALLSGLLVFCIDRMQIAEIHGFFIFLATVGLCLIFFMVFCLYVAHLENEQQANYQRGKGANIQTYFSIDRKNDT